MAGSREPGAGGKSYCGALVAGIKVKGGPSVVGRSVLLSNRDERWKTGSEDFVCTFEAGIPDETHINDYLD